MTAAADLLAKCQEANDSPVKPGFKATVSLERNYAAKVATVRVILPYNPAFDEATGNTTFSIPDCLGTDGLPSTLADELEAELIKAANGTVNEGFTANKVIERSYTNQILNASIVIPLEEAIAADGMVTFSAADFLTLAV